MTLYNYRIVYPLLHEVPQMEDIFIFHNQNANVTIVHEEGVRQLGCWSSFTTPPIALLQFACLSTGCKKVKHPLAACSVPGYTGS